MEHVQEKKRRFPATKIIFCSRWNWRLSFVEVQTLILKYQITKLTKFLIFLKKICYGFNPYMTCIRLSSTPCACKVCASVKEEALPTPPISKEDSSDHDIFSNLPNWYPLVYASLPLKILDCHSNNCNLVPLNNLKDSFRFWVLHGPPIVDSFWVNWANCSLLLCQAIHCIKKKKSPYSFYPHTKF